MSILAVQNDFEQYITEQPFDFARHSTVGCGGLAPIGVYPRSEEELTAIIQRLQERNVGFYVLGNLSNVLPPEGNSEKAVICTGRMTKIIALQSGVYAEAGVMSGVLMRALRQMGYSGAEFLTGIPCTLGGALYMNAGAGGKYISEIVDSVRVYRDGEVIELPVKACEYAYKHSVFMDRNDVVLGGTLRLRKTDAQTALAEQQRWQEKRAHLPKGKSMGCIFKNPPNVAAGELIEKSGLKGLRVGGAKVSEEHANFIINDKAATPNDIIALIKIIQNGVFRQYGILLEEEIRYL